MYETGKNIHENDDKKGKQEYVLFIKRLQYPPLVNDRNYGDCFDSDLELGNNDNYFIF